MSWTPAIVTYAATLAAAACAATAVTAAWLARRTRKVTAELADHVDRVWRQVRGVEQLDELQREELAVWLYEQFGGYGYLPWDELNEDGREEWRQRAVQVAAQTTLVFVTRT